MRFNLLTATDPEYAAQRQHSNELYAIQDILWQSEFQHLDWELTRQLTRIEYLIEDLGEAGAARVLRHVASTYRAHRLELHQDTMASIGRTPDGKKLAA